MSEHGLAEHGLAQQGMEGAELRSAQAGFRDLLQQRGLRYSRPRALILAYFRERAKHVTAETLYLELQERGYRFSLSTVYLNLRVLAEAELIREFIGANGEALYDSSVAPHHHLICKRCGAVLDLPVLDLGGEAPARLLQRHAEHASGWQVDAPSLELFGVCRVCSARE